MKLLFFLISIVNCSRLAPLLIASHRLVDVKSSSPTDIIREIVTQCSSDAYIIINQPGLVYTDLTTEKKDDWPMLRKYLYMSSTIIGLPRVPVLDLDYIEKYIISTCDAETISGDIEYYDIRKRVIRLDTENTDEMIRKVLRKLPSPHYTIILTSTEPGYYHPLPEYNEVHDIFHDILSTHKNIEKNDRFHNIEPNWNP
ncbi:unnamed protein product [Candida verbasci]|uniref:Protein BIG1 n=1 Tax=Candida verbasci TaxID=1227364 RepID=A0A9W4TS50_9ASCO|nr:unnamed protein product [Candida verbasci]